MKKEPLDNNRTKYSCYLSSTDIEFVKGVFYSIAENEKLPDELPEIKNEKIPMVLSLDTKHCIYRYKVDSLVELEKVARHILKMRHDEDYYWNPYENKPDKNITGFDSKEKIEALPNGNVKRMALKEWDDYEENVKNQKGYEKNWDELLSVIDGKGMLANVMRVLRNLEGDIYRLEKLEIVE
jgi:hypothetical protein